MAKSGKTLDSVTVGHACRIARLGGIWIVKGEGDKPDTIKVRNAHSDVEYSLPKKTDLAK
jgi:hypothetical protein